MRRFRILYISLSLFIFAALFCLPAGLKKWTCSFHTMRCIPPIIMEEQGVIFSKLEADEISKILSQPFRYLDRGAQSFVFSSLDGLYVLKLFFFDLFPKFHKQNNIEKVKKTMRSCRIAAGVAEETGLIYLHFGPSKELLPKLLLLGPAWHCTHLEGAGYCFALQKRAILLKESLRSAYLEKNRGVFIKRLETFLDQRRISMGIRNSDRSLYSNFGFVEDRAIEIDFGNYYHETDTCREKEIARYKKRLSEWASIETPEWKEEIESR